MVGKRSRSRWSHVRLAAVLAVLLAPRIAFGQAPSAPGAPDRGERLFAGTARFANGGPACAECHDIAGLPFPHGGSVGPDLSRAYSKYGAEPLETVLSTLFFPTMQALFTGRVLTPAERTELAAFFERADAARSHRPVTVVLAAAALLGAILLLAIASVTWRGRLRGVRRPLIAEGKGRRSA